MAVTSPFPRSALFLIPTIGLSACYRKSTKVTPLRRKCLEHPETGFLVAPESARSRLRGKGRRKVSSGISKLRQHDALLFLIFPFSVRIADLADFVGLKEEYLAEAFIGVDPGR